MTTVRQIEKTWNAGTFPKLLRHLLAGRPEASLRLEGDLGRALPTAALAIIRLEELGQSHLPLAGRLIRFLLQKQESDGGWGDAMTTALAVRALRCGRGDGLAIQRGLQWLACLQKAEGSWPRIPLRRMPADRFVSAFILFQLGNDPRFREAVRFQQALDWMAHPDDLSDPEAQRLWDRAAARCRLTPPQAELVWS